MTRMDEWPSSDRITGGPHNACCRSLFVKDDFVDLIVVFSQSALLGIDALSDQGHALHHTREGCVIANFSERGRPFFRHLL